MRKHILALTSAVIASALLLSACGKEESEPVTASPGMSAAAVSPTAVTGASTKPGVSPAASMAASPSPSSNATSGEVPENLPKDFPLPADAKITTSHSGTTDGKKTALLVLTTKESMDAVTKRYKDYFNGKLGRDAVQTIDEKNVIIQGFTQDNKQSWSMIGGKLSSQEGVIELTVTWAET
jgi:hypothetical protein